MVQAVLFDLDFTLCDASDGIRLCVEHALTTMGKPLPEPERIRRSIGLSLPETYRFLTGDHGADAAEREFESHFLTAVPTHLTANTRLYPGVADTLAQLRGYGLRTALVTSKYREAVEELLERHALAPLFDCVVCGDDVSATKPSPEALALCCQTLDVDHYVYIGDSHVDLQAVSNHGQGHFLPVLTGTVARADFEQAGVTAAIEHIAAAPQALAERLWPAPAAYGELQAQVDRMVSRLGGYWSAPSAMLRVIEELGELGAALRAGDVQEIADEMADLFIITTCLANQYCAVLPERHDVLAPEAVAALPALGAQDSLAALLEIAGELARRVNAYDGDKPPKASEAHETVEMLVARFHARLMRLGATLHLRITDQIQSKIDACMARDASRFASKFDPAASPVLTGFRHVQQQTSCPFAKRAKVWGAPQWDDGIGFAANVVAIAPHLRRFARISRHEGLDVFVVALPDHAGATLDALQESTFRLLDGFTRLEDSRGLVPDDVGVAGWQFTFGGERFFVTTHAACYPRSHSRHAYGCGQTLFAFHPEHSFDSPRFNVNGPVFHNVVQKLFANNGQAYADGAAMRTRVEAAKYVKPLNLDDAVVEWWRTSSTAN